MSFAQCLRVVNEPSFSLNPSRRLVPHGQELEILSILEIGIIQASVFPDPVFPDLLYHRE